jgi:archaellum biogenesis ATPase FlaH
VQTEEYYVGDVLRFISDVGFPIAAAMASGYLVFLTIKFILDGVTGSVMTLSGIVKSLNNRVQTMNNDLVKIDALMSYALGVRPNVDRIAAKDGKEDARKD